MDAVTKLDRWEDRREIKNLMGIYSQCLLLKKEPVVYETCWAHRDDVCLGFNNGWFAGADAVRGYYETIDQATRMQRDLLMKLYPEQCAGKTEEELYGIGGQEIKSLNNAIVEVAGDGKTAKYFAVCIGLVSQLDETGANSNWVYSYWCADLVKEDGGWKLWHFCELKDIDNTCGTKWGVKDPPKANAPEPGFEGFAQLPVPQPNVPATLRELYHSGRAFTQTPPLPEPYETFAETFSYGMEGGAAS